MDFAKYRTVGKLETDGRHITCIGFMEEVTHNGPRDTSATASQELRFTVDTTRHDATLASHCSESPMAESVESSRNSTATTRNPSRDVLLQEVPLHEQEPHNRAGVELLEQPKAPCLSSGEEIDAKNTLQSHSVLAPHPTTVETETRTVTPNLYKEMLGISTTRSLLASGTVATASLKESTSSLFAQSEESFRAVDCTSTGPSNPAAMHAAAASMRSPTAVQSVHTSVIPVNVHVRSRNTVAPSHDPVFATACFADTTGMDPATQSLPIQSISPDSMTLVSNTNSRVSGLTEASAGTGTPAKQIPQSQRRSGWILAMAALVVAAIILGTVCGSNHCVSSATTDSTPDSTGTNHLVDFIQTITLSGREIAVLTTKASKHELAEELALRWLMYEDPLSLQPTSSTNRFRLQQRYALLTLIMQREGEQSNVSLPNTLINECEWWGVTCQTLEVEGETRNVVSGIALSAWNLSGSLPHDVGLLSAGLMHLNVSHNGLAGSLPESLDQCTNLETVDFSLNRGFVGTIPTSWGTQWTNLQRFSAAWNDLTGSLPTELGHWSRLVYFSVPHNKMTGSIPSVFGERWTNLVQFDVGISDASEFERLNRLTGTIPETLSRWTRLRHCNLAWNYLVGTLPESLQLWTALEVFDVQEIIGLEGTLPTVFGAAWSTSLRHFDVSSNFFVGSLPTSYTLWTNLEYFDANDNQFTGTLSKSLAQWTKLRYLSLAFNRLTGTLPQVLGPAWPQLQEFDVGSNQFKGSLPESIGDWTSLMFFAVNDNSLTGSLPSSIGQWTRLSYMFNVDRNSLTGTLPDSIGQLSRLERFSVASNGFTGTIPDSIEGWTMVNIAFFEANNFTGHMPDGICGTNITVLGADCMDEITCSCCTSCNLTIGEQFFYVE